MDNAGELLERTTSICPGCFALLPAEIRARGCGVYLVKTCPLHGPFRGLIWSDRELYERSFRYTKPGTLPVEFGASRRRGCPYDCGICPDHQQHTCLAIVEITQRCNLQCPICIASSGSGWNLSIERIRGMLRSLLRYEGHPIPIQFSGGEPTVRKDLVDIVRAAKELGFTFMEIDSNGVELARRRDLAARLVDAGLSGVYLQFDGFSPEATARIRGRDLLDVKLEAIRRCQEGGLPVTLGVTVVKGVNDGELWDIVRFGIEQRLVGANFQPFTPSGRYPHELGSPDERMTTSDVMRGVEQQSAGRILATDFISIPCQDNRCAVLAYLLVKDSEIVPVNRMVDVGYVLDYYANLSNWDDLLQGLRDAAWSLWSCSAMVGCSNPAALADLCCGKFSNADAYFTVGCHGMQDRWNFDIGRVKKCCFQALIPSGRLVPFCLYNLGLYQREAGEAGVHVEARMEFSSVGDASP